MKKKLCIMLAMLMLILCIGSSALAADHEVIKKSVVRVFIQEDVSIVDVETEQVYETKTYHGFGTAFAIGKPGEPVKYFVTNEHVAPADSYYIDSVNVKDSSGQVSSRSAYFITDYTYYLIFDNIMNRVLVEYVSSSDRADLSLLELMSPTTQRQAAVIRPFETMDYKEDLAACGFPYVAEYENEGQYYSGYDQMVVTYGKAALVKEHTTTKQGQLLLHNIPTSGGNSGSPVVDKNGHVFGVHSHVYLDDSESSEFKGAVSSNELLRFLTREGLTQGVDYVTTDDITNPMLLVAIAVLGVMLIVVIVLLLMQKKGGSKSGGHSSSSKSSKTPYTLVGTVGAHAGKSYTITGEVVRLGRNTSQCTIGYPADAGGVSAMHCELKSVSGGVQVTDLGSSYGTWIDKVKLQANVPAIMVPGQTLSIGSKQQRFMLRK